MELVREKQKASTKALLKPGKAFFHFGWAENWGGGEKKKKRKEKKKEKKMKGKKEKKEKKIG